VSVIFLLIAVSLVFASGFLIAFIWAMKDRQFEDDHTPAVRMLFENSVSGGQQVSKSADQVLSKSGAKVLSDSRKLFCEDVKKTSPDPSLTGGEIRGQALSSPIPRPSSL
jgi:cbb3-type cytochrome oxidase maturation protein